MNTHNLNNFKKIKKIISILTTGENTFYINKDNIKYTRNVNRDNITTRFTDKNKKIYYQGEERLSFALLFSVSNYNNYRFNMNIF